MEHSQVVIRIRNAHLRSRLEELDCGTVVPLYTLPFEVTDAEIISCICTSVVGGNL